jgi:uncharacterized protein YhaN
MRIRKLILDKYGPFSGRTLQFRPDAKLHIVFGPNEAGKSCALAAITDLLFSIEPRTRYDFLHKPKDLRIGGVIEALDGSQIIFQRRKGTKDTLLDALGAPIPDEKLIPFLGNLTREVFVRAFGLNTETLRLGAEDMLKSGGEIGATLFAAASGLRGMTDLRHRLESEAEAIFAPRAAKDRRFYQILDRYEAARRQVRELELKAADWQALNLEIEGYSEKLREFEAKRAENSAEEARLSRLKRIAPLVRIIDADLAELLSIGALPQVAGDFADRLQAALERHREATRESARALDNQQSLELELSSIVLDEALLASATEIQSLVAKTGAYEKDQRDTPRIQAEADGYSAELKQVAKRLGMSDVEHVLLNQPTDPVCVAVKSLILEGKRLIASLEQCVDSITSETDTLSDLERERAAHEVVPNPRLLRDKLTALDPVLKQLGRRSEIERACVAETQSIEGAAARLHPSIVDIDALAAASLPSVETITRFRIEHDRFLSEFQRAKDLGATLAETISGTEKRLQSMKSHGSVPSREAIVTEREERDKAWVLLRDSMIGTTAPLTGAELTGTIVDFEKHGSEADRLADSALANAELVATHAAEVAHLAEQQAEQVSASEREAALKTDYDVHMKAWKEIWQPAIDPLPPLEMAAWLSQVQSLVLRLDKNNALADELVRIDAAVAAIRPEMESLASEAGVRQLNATDASALMTQVNTRLAAVEKLWDGASKLATSIANSQSRIAKLRKASDEATTKLDGWRLRWERTVPTIGLNPCATIEQAEAALSAWQKVPDILRERDNRERRVSGMQRDSKSFEERVCTIIGIAAADLSSLPVEVAIKSLNERLNEATSAKARRDQVATRLNKVSQTLQGSERILEEATTELNTLTIAVPSGTDLSELLERFSRQEELSKTLSEHRDQLIAQGEGFTEDQLRSGLETFNVDDAVARLQQLSQEDSQMESEAREAFANRKLAINRREELHKGVGAELANQQRKNAETELLNAARDWTVLKLGALLVGRAIEKARASQHSPLINRAGELFSTITGGSFIGIAQDFGEDDTPYLAGRRSSQELVAIPGLSEGARDQLYLSLRLAYIEQFAKNAEPVPFIGDDLFTSSDEYRTANGLLALAAIGGKVQPILFTHHRHVTNIARERIGDAVDIIDMERGEVASTA